MSERRASSPSRSSDEFVATSLLDTVVPVAPDQPIEDAFDAWDGTSSSLGSSLLPFIEQRQFLLFDEHVPVYVILRVSHITKNKLRGHLSQLATTLEAYAVDIVALQLGRDVPNPSGPSPARPVAQPKDLLNSERIANSEDPYITVRECRDRDNSNSNPTKYVYVVWKKQLYLGRPKIRLQKPAIYLAATASLQQVKSQDEKPTDDEYLQSSVPSPLNLLEPFNHDPAFAGRNLYLSAARVTKVAPAAPAVHDLSRPLRTGNRKLFQAAPAAILRVHYTRLPPGSEFSVLASLDLEITAFASSVVRVTGIHPYLHDGICETAARGEMHLPMLLNPGDEATWVQYLAPASITDVNAENGNIHLLEIRVQGEVLLSEDCTAAIELRWRNNVDLGPPPPTPGQRNSQILARARGLSTSSIISGAFVPRASTENVGDEARPPALDDFGVTVTFSGPSDVRVGEILRWDMLIFNRSPHSRRLAIIPIPKRKQSDSKQQLTKGNEGILASPVLDEHTLYGLQVGSKMDPPGLVSLSSDSRIG
ncbi:MAG: hypothetical protein M1820_009480 [Bogoriella megaspora]|nr:MAG: hypothetical protein M1820_009480 [Bogoriella megaspora]